MTAIAQVGSEWGNSGVGSGGTTLALPSHGDGVSTILTGDIIVVAAESAVATGNTAAGANTPSQTAGTATLGTFTLLSSTLNNNGTIRVEWWGVSIIAGGSVTITISPNNSGTAVSSGINGSALEFSNAKVTADVTLTANGSGTAVSSGTSAQTAQANELILCAAAWKSPTATFSPAPAFTPATTLNAGAVWNVTGSDNSSLQVNWQIQGSSKSTEGFSGTLTSSTNWGLCLVTIEQATADNSSSLQAGWLQPTGTSLMAYAGTLSASEPWAAVMVVYSATAPTAPAQVTGVSASGGNGNGAINWNTPANGGSTLLSYSLKYFIAGVLQATITGIPIQDYSAATGSPYILSPLSNGTTYTVEVAAVNAVNTGAYSTASSGFTPSSGSTKPSTPAQPSVVVGDQVATSTLTPPSNGGSPLTSYTFNCYQGSDLIASYTVPVAQGTSFVFNENNAGLVDGVEYGFTCLVANANGSSPESTATLATPQIAPSDTNPWIPAPAGMYLPALFPIDSWDVELYATTGGLGDPPPVNSVVLVAYVDMDGYFLKFWQLVEA